MAHARLSLLHGPCLVAALALALAACQSPTPYQQADGGFGYAVQQLEDNRYRVTFAGNALTPRETVQNYLLLRAAEVTLESGHDYFRIVDQDLERNTRYHGTVYPSGFHHPHWVLDRRHDRFFPRHFYGPSSVSAYPVDQYKAFADILVFEGEKPADDVHAYDARDVVERLQPAVVREVG